jgi:hypothetical protein
VIGEIDTERLARVHATRDGLATADDCAALAERIDDEISGLGMRLLALYPEKRYVLGRLLNDARVAVAETLRFVGIEEGGR